MAWVKTINVKDATGKLAQLYKRILRPDGNVDNIMKIHSLRPHTLEGHMYIYKYILHHSGNKIDKWFLEAIGTYVSYLNQCEYCFEHHYKGMERLVDNQSKSDAIRNAIMANTLDHAFDAKQMAALSYASKLTIDLGNIAEQDIVDMRAAGWDDGEIVEINQVSAYFSYANRTIMGLGGSLKGDIVGLSPNKNDAPDDWSHD
ncbi:MAG: peroxidase-related enzyme [Rhizobiales bacterium]|nr:peroxidase-related enzyme [Hyphomicrobiales bacterium]NRB15360.1 peroxidase-related enzyme [Hyphomicrobiales bacterium]